MLQCILDYLICGQTCRIRVLKRSFSAQQYLIQLSTWYRKRMNEIVLYIVLETRQNDLLRVQITRDDNKEQEKISHIHPP